MDATERFTELVRRSPDEVPLDETALLIAKHAHPDLDLAGPLGELDQLADTVPGTTADDVAGALFGEGGLAGNTVDYADPRNSYLDDVLARRLGIPISLSVVMIEVGRRRGIPIYGVGMPGHFLVKYETGRYRIFVDSFNGGALLTQRDCARFLDQAGYGFDERFLQKTPARSILIRMIKNLVAIYNKMGDIPRAARLTRYIEILGLPDKED